MGNSGCRCVGVNNMPGQLHTVMFQCGWRKWESSDDQALSSPNFTELFCFASWIDNAECWISNFSMTSSPLIGNETALICRFVNFPSSEFFWPSQAVWSSKLITTMILDCMWGCWCTCSEHIEPAMMLQNRLQCLSWLHLVTFLQVLYPAEAGGSCDAWDSMMQSEHSKKSRVEQSLFFFPQLLRFTPLLSQ